MASALAEPLTPTQGSARPNTPPRSPAARRVGSPRTLGRYTGPAGERELIALARPDASTLLLDTEAGSLAGALLVAHLSSDEPQANADLVVEMYLSDPTRGRCRRLRREDLAEPTPDASTIAATNLGGPAAIELPGARYEIRPVAVRPGALQLRWMCSCSSPRVSSTLTLREVVGTLERYEPARAITARTIARPVPDTVGVSHLTLELTRLLRSPIILNRGLREAVARAILAGATMSEIAMRCGRFKSDRNGQRSGETSWLARRIGQMPEGGQAQPTPWIHSDTLALIARDGLHLSPGEVEL